MIRINQITGVANGRAFSIELEGDLTTVRMPDQNHPDAKADILRLVVRTNSDAGELARSTAGLLYGTPNRIPACSMGELNVLWDSIKLVAGISWT